MRRNDLRINIIGTSGAGKTTLARRVAQRLDIPHTEIDALHFGPNWTSRPDAEFHGDLRRFAAGESWVLCGNYTKARPAFADRVNVFVWLDYARWRVTWRVVRRTLGRCWTGQELWAGNRENFRMSFFSRDSIIWWSMTNHSKNRRKYPALFAELADNPNIQTVRLRSPRDAERWLASLDQAGASTTSNVPVR